MFYYIRHFLLSEKLYAIFLWHGKNDRTFRPEKSNATGGVILPSVLFVFLSVRHLCSSLKSVHALKHAIAEKVQVGVRSNI